MVLMEGRKEKREFVLCDAGPSGALGALAGVAEAIAASPMSSMRIVESHFPEHSSPNETLIVAPLVEEEVELFRERFSPPGGSGWVVASMCPSFEQALEQLARGALDYIDGTRGDLYVSVRLRGGGDAGHMSPSTVSLAQPILNLFDSWEPSTPTDWRTFLEAIAVVLDVDHVGVVLSQVGTVYRNVPADAGERSTRSEVVVLPFPAGEAGRGAIVLERFSARPFPLDGDGLAEAIAGRLISRQLQHDELLSKILRAKLEWEGTVDAIRDPVAMVDAHDVVVRANKAYADLVRLSVRDVVGKSLVALFGTAANELRSWPNEVEGVSPLRIELPVDSDSWFEINRVPLARGDASILYLRNVTEERKLTALLVQRERFWALGELADGVFHDLNNLASTLKPELHCAMMTLPALTSVVENGTVPGPSAQQFLDDVAVLSASLEAAIQATRRLEELLSNLRQYGRLRQGNANEPEVKWHLVEVNQLLRALPVLFNGRARQRGVDLRLSLNPGASIRGNASELMRVFENLLKNALEATPPGGRVDIATSRDEDRVKVVVTDTGCGIPPELITRIFRRGFTSREHEGGTGLGLHVTQQIVDTHHGTIRVNSEPNKGTSFEISFPACDDWEPSAL